MGKDNLNAEQRVYAPTQIDFRPIETAPWDWPVLLTGPSGYIAPHDTFITSGYRVKDWHHGEWNDETGTRLSDRGWVPTGWAPWPVVLETVYQALPDEYHPGQTDEPEEEEETDPVYAIGYAKGNGGYGMGHGPVLDVMDMLNVIPEEDAPAFIFSMQKNRVHERIYRWHKGRQAWVRFREEEKP